MSIESKVSRIKQLTTYTVTGEVTLEEILNEVEIFYQDDPTENVLWNFLKADLWRLNAKGAEQISSFPRRYDPDNRRKKTAIVAQDEHIYQLSGWFKQYGEIDELPFDVKIFRTLEEAYFWLDFNSFG